MVEDAIAEDGSEVLHAPELIKLESLQALRLLNRAGKVSDDDVQAAVQALGDAQVAHHSALPFVGRIWELRHNLSAYDASYLALAETRRPAAADRRRRHRRTGPPLARP